MLILLLKTRLDFFIMIKLLNIIDEQIRRRDTKMIKFLELCDGELSKVRSFTHACIYTFTRRKFSLSGLQAGSINSSRALFTPMRVKLPLKL